MNKLIAHLSAAYSKIHSKVFYLLSESKALRLVWQFYFQLQEQAAVLFGYPFFLI